MFPVADACCSIALAIVGTSLQSAPPPVDTIGISEVIEAFMDGAELRGVAVAVVTPGEVPFTAAFGSDGRGGALTPDHTFHLGAVTEALTAAAILRLAESGRIHLDAPVLDYLPSLRTRDQARTEALSVRHLLTHTSGFTALSGFNRRLRDEGRFETIDLAREPGTRREASAANYILLGQILESVTGTEYPHYLQESVLDPVGMSRTGVLPTTGTEASLVPGYGFTMGVQVRRPPPKFKPFTHPALGAQSSVRDLARLLLNLVPTTAPLDRLSFESAVQPGFAWTRTLWEGREAFRTAGATSGYTADLIIFPDQAVGIALLTNRTPGFVAPTSEALLRAIVTTLDGGAPEPRADVQRWVSLTLGLVMLALLLRTVSLGRSWQRLDRPRAVAHPPQIVLRLVLDIALAGGVPLVALLGLLEMSFPAALSLYPDLGMALVVIPILGGPCAVLKALGDSERWRRTQLSG